MIDATTLLADTRRTVNDLVNDLRQVAAKDPAARAHVADEYQRAHTAGRTALGQSEWAEGLYAQVAVAWTLGCVFVRFCEDNGLISEPLLGGPGLRAQLALDQRAAHLHENPAHDDRHWLRDAFGRLRALPATGHVFAAHNPIWLEALLPSADGARRLREDLTRIDPNTGQLRHDFTDPEWNTRFLGDLYQDLSDHAKKTFALLQTPIFVEEFILDRTLDLAINTFGLADTTLIDPTCGSGHFLLGAFARIFERWVNTKPGANRRVLAQRALDAIGGVDLNPFAASIARFRLLLTALRAGGDTRLADAPAYDLNIAVGDSLLHGDPSGALPGMHIPGEEEALLAAHGYTAEDHEATRDLLSRQWKAVVGNPPYIVVKDPALNAAYRRRFATCHRQYSLGVPFTERFWQLAQPGDTSHEAGFIGLITANSFMKREFGTRFVREWIPRHDLTHVIDTSGAFIPGHGTPTVILFGRNRPPVSSTVRAVLGIRGEPSQPSDPARGLVWSSIERLIDTVGEATDFASSSDLDRSRLSSHPWSIGGGGASDLKDRIEKGAASRLAERTLAISGISYTRLDDAYFAPPGAWQRRGVADRHTAPLVTGEDVRDWCITTRADILFPYDWELKAEESPPVIRSLWPNKEALRRRRELGGYQEEIGLTWYEWNRFLKHHHLAPFGIVFSNVSTHGHFVLRRGDEVFNAHAPMIKFKAGMEDETRYLEVLGVLNSSVGCFWLRQVSHDKGNRGEGGGITAEAWERFYEFDGTKVKQFPLPESLPLESSRRLDELALQLSTNAPTAIIAQSVPIEAALKEAKRSTERLRSELLAKQEHLDWECYRAFGLIDQEDVVSSEPEPPLSFGERAFEIVLARRMKSGHAETAWFERNRAVAVTELPAHWPPTYRALVERRIELIEADSDIGLIERPEYKRRWASRPWDEQVESALRSWLLNRLEERRYWSDPAAIISVARLTAEARTDEDFVRVARLYLGREDVDLAGLIGELIRAESVAYLAGLRFTDSGLRKHGEWLATWALQRRDDAGESVVTIPVPPKYAKPDYTGVGWEHRGRLDVPKERFISYPGAERETDASAVIGWAGWDHLERARALAAWYLQAKRDARDRNYLTPLLAGLAELVPWLKQWYDEPNADPSLDRPGSQVGALVDTELRSLGLTHDDLAAWRPPATAKRGRPRKASS